MPLKVAGLGDTLQEIYSAAHRQKPNVVASPWSSSIYDSACGLGRFWRWIYKIVSLCKCLDWHTLEARRMIKATAQTQLVFEKQLEEITNYVEKYATYVQQCCKGEKSSEDSVTEARNSFIDWQEQVDPFIKLVKNGQNRSFNTLLEERFPKILRDLKLKDSQVHRLESCLQVVEVEGLFETALPLQMLWKISRNEEISKAEFKGVKKFKKKINKLCKEKQLNAQKLHRLFQAVVELAAEEKKSPKEIARQVAIVEYRLMQEGMKGLFVEDKEHVAWRGSLKEGDAISFNDHIYTLGAQLDLPEQETKRIHAAVEKPKSLNKNLVFAVKERSDAVLIIGFNKAMVGTKQIMGQFYKSQGGIIATAACLDVDTEGRFALYERIPHSLSQITWEATSEKEKLSKRDKEQCKPFIDFAKKCLEKDRTPRHLVPRHLGLDHAMNLKCLRETEDIRLDFNALEELFERISNQASVYAYLMKESGLVNHLYAQFYKDMVQYALENEKKEEVNEAEFAKLKARYKGAGIYYASIIDKGQALYEKVKMIKQKSVEILQERHKMTEEVAQKKFDEAFKHRYTIISAGGVLWGDFQNDVLKSIEEGEAERKKSAERNLAVKSVINTVLGSIGMKGINLLT